MSEIKRYKIEIEIKDFQMNGEILSFKHDVWLNDKIIIQDQIESGEYCHGGNKEKIEKLKRYFENVGALNIVLDNLEIKENMVPDADYFFKFLNDKKAIECLRYLVEKGYTPDQVKEAMLKDDSMGW